MSFISYVSELLIFPLIRSFKIMPFPVFCWYFHRSLGSQSDLFIEISVKFVKHY